MHSFVSKNILFEVLSILENSSIICSTIAPAYFLTLSFEDFNYMYVKDYYYILCFLLLFQYFLFFCLIILSIFFWSAFQFTNSLF